MKMLKKYSGIYFPILVFAAGTLCLWTLFRAGLALWQSERMAAGENYWLDLFLGGFRIDLSLICWTSLVLSALTFLASFFAGTLKVWNKILRVLLVILAVVFIFMELSTPTFIQTYDIRPNRLFFEYLTNPKEVFAMLFEGHLLATSLTTVLTGTLAFGVWKLSAFAFRGNGERRAVWKNALPLLVIVPFCVLCGRGSLGHRPINPAMVAFADDNLLNSLATNSTYSVVFSAVQMSSEADSAKIYGKMPEAEMLGIIREASGRPESDYISEKYPTLTHNVATGVRKNKRNIVVILEESLGARYIGSLGGNDLSPNFDKLSQEGWLFKNLYCTGTRSVRGIEAVITGFTPTPARSVVKLDKSQRRFYTIANQLLHNNYLTQFIYGGESHFDNMASFFYGNGFCEVIDERDFDEEELVTPKTTWGVSDEDLFIRANKEFEKNYDAGTPFFALVFTSSNHDPFDVPERPGLVYKDAGRSRNNSVQYADYALGKFFELAKKSNYYKDTIFLVVADHDSRVSGATLMPFDHYHIPALLLNCGQRVDERLVSQIDLPPTLLSLAGISCEYPMLGFDLTRDKNPNRAMMQFDKNFAYMRGISDGKAEAVVLANGKRIAMAYDLNTRESQTLDVPVDEEFGNLALATVLLGSYLYKYTLYPDVETILAESDND